MCSYRMRHPVLALVAVPHDTTLTSELYAHMKSSGSSNTSTGTDLYFTHLPAFDPIGVILMIR